MEMSYAALNGHIKIVFVELSRHTTWMVCLMCDGTQTLSKIWKHKLQNDN